MESMETGACLWMVTNQNVFVIRVEKLEQLGKNEARNWKSNLVPPPFDFHFSLPKSKLHPFILDSKLFFAGGTRRSSPKIHQLNYAGGTTLDIADAVAAGTFPQGPTLLHDCYVANLHGEVYLLANDALNYRERETMGFWVLRSSSSGSKKWHPLSLPPTLLGRRDWWDCFVWRDKLFLEVPAYTEERGFPENIIFYVYDPQTDDSWKQLELPFSYPDSKYHPPSIMHVSSLEDVGNCSVAMTWSTGKDRASRHELKIHALLVDNEENCIRGNQCLDEVCEAIIPSSFDSHGDRNVNFVDLGKGKICVLIGGMTKDKPATRNELLCVLVIQLCLQQEEEGQRFLSVEVLVNQVYNMLPYANCPAAPFFSR